MQISRRGFLAASAVASAAALAGCATKSTDVGSTAKASGSAAAGAVTLNVFISGDTNVQDMWQKNIVPAYQKANPNVTVNVQLDLHGEHDAQTQSKLTAANASKQDPGIDLVDGGFVAKLAQAGVLEKISKSAIANLADVPQEMIDAGMGGGIPYRGSSVLLACNSKIIADAPKTLEEMLAWIKQNPGQFTYCPPKSGGSGGAFVATVLDANMSEDVRKQFRTSYNKDLEKNWDAGWLVLRGLNASIYQKGVYPNGNAQVLELLAKGGIAMATVWSDQFLTGRKNGQIPDYVKATQISNPSFTGSASYLGIPAVSPRKAEALKLANFVLAPEQQKLIVDKMSGYPVIPLSKMDADTQKVFADAHPEILRQGFFGDFGSDMNKGWDEQVPGK